METRFNSDMARSFGSREMVSTGVEAEREQQSLRKSSESAKKEEPRAEEMDAMVEDIREMARMFEHELQFRIEEDLDRPVVEVKDVQNDEVIRQIPSEEMVELARNMERIRGILFDESA
jgi:flagellar protein FlaG